MISFNFVKASVRYVHLLPPFYRWRHSEGGSAVMQAKTFSSQSLHGSFRPCAWSAVLVLGMAEPQSSILGFLASQIRWLRRGSFISSHLNERLTICQKSLCVYFCKCHQMSDTDDFSISRGVHQGDMYWWNILICIFLTTGVTVSNSKARPTTAALQIFKASAPSLHSTWLSVDKNHAILHDAWSCQLNDRTFRAGEVMGG